jgi:hypothetical protein
MSFCEPATARALLVMALTLAIAPETVNCQKDSEPQAKSHAQPAGKSNERPQPSVQDPHFSADDREMIRVYFKTLFWQQGTAGPGQPAARTPEARTQLEPSVAVPTKMRKTMRPFPRELESQLSQLPPNYARASINNDILIFHTLTYRVVDIVHDFLSSGLERPKP